ncbi:MAG TPA: VOC family protein [Casimicrobiaceae bacterium]|nr:VOC family protein [Casimicrobiaceae bacterium]
MAVEPIPAGYSTVTPYLIVRPAKLAIDFYKRAFEATEVLRLNAPDGSIGHAELRIGDSLIMLADGMDGYPDPHNLGGSPVSLHVYVRDVDTVFDRAIAAGATVKRAVANQFYGDRNGILVDPFGHVWSLATHVEDVSPEEIDRRFRAMTGT